MDMNISIIAVGSELLLDKLLIRMDNIYQDYLIVLVKA